ncbi:G-protein alpha subunit [Mycena sanguinolenta]|nr:G-protein alpha subunit [Mycena sanguinolenta]
MGVCASQPDRASKSRSDEIDRQLDEDSKRYRKECRILLLGSGESGKSTIRLAYRKTIWKNTVDSAQAVVEAIRKCGMEDLLARDNEHFPEAILRADSGQELIQETVEAIEALWGDPVVARVLYKHQSDESPFLIVLFLGSRNANAMCGSFLTDIHRLAHPDYMPTEQDVLRARAQSTTITETRFNKGSLPIHMFEVCARSLLPHLPGCPIHRERSSRFALDGMLMEDGSVTSLIFCTALSEYDQVLLEKGQNRMRESLVLFKSVINSRWFLRTKIILFLNKVDVFRAKLRKIPLERSFPEYTGGPDMMEAAK